MPLGESNILEGVSGKRPLHGVKPNKQFPERRVCAKPGCGTFLSVYNGQEECHLHAPTSFGRVRGRDYSKQKDPD
jgi:hypothetical protein